MLSFMVLQKFKFDRSSFQDHGSQSSLLSLSKLTAKERKECVESRDILGTYEKKYYSMIYALVCLMYLNLKWIFKSARWKIDFADEALKSVTA